MTEDRSRELEEDEYYYHEIIGCTVVTEEGEELGVDHGNSSPGANDVWVVKLTEGQASCCSRLLMMSCWTWMLQPSKVTVHLMEG